MVDLRAELCKICIHTEVCRLDKNMFGDHFVPGDPKFCDNRELFEKYLEWKEAGFPCEYYCKNSTDEKQDIIKRRMGKWIYAVLPNDNGGLPVIVCDQCNTFYPLAYAGGGHKFCPNCGCRMKGEEDARTQL